MNQFPGHKCQLIYGSRTYLPKLLPTAPWWQKLSRNFRKSLIVSTKNPITSRYFKSQASIAREHRRQAKLPYIVIHPCCHFLAYWHVIVLFTFSIYLFLIPFYIAFYEKLPVPGIFSVTIQIMIAIVLYMEIVVKLYTGYYDKANEIYVLCRKQIRKRYLTSTLFPDIISSFPGLLILRMYSDYEHLKFQALICLYITFLCFLFSFLNIPSILRYYRIVSVHFDFTARTDLMVKLGVCSLYIIHLATLFSEIIPALGNFLEENAFAYALVSKLNLQDSINQNDNSLAPNTTELNDFIYIYARAFLFTLEGFVACGFVDLNEINNIYKKYVNTFTMLFGWICKAFFIIILKQTIMSHDRSAALYDAFMRDVKEYCTKFKLPNDLTENIFMYIEYKFRNNYFNEEHIFRTLSGRIKSQITMDQCKQLVEQVDIFKNLPNSTIKNIMSCLKLEIYLPGEFIIRADDQGSKMFFLETGSAIVLTQTGKELKYLADGSYFGEIALLIEDRRRTASVKAVELCETYSLSKIDFFNVIEPNSDLLAQMRQHAFELIQETNKST